MEQKPNFIKVSKENKRKLQRVFKVGKSTIGMALNGYRTNETAKKIRHVALTQYGGIELAPVKRATK